MEKIHGVADHAHFLKKANNKMLYDGVIYKKVNNAAGTQASQHKAYPVVPGYPYENEKWKSQQQKSNQVICF